MTHLFSDPAVVEASLKAVSPGALAGCTCFWDEHGNPPAGCRCSERAWAEAHEDRREALAAAVAALPRAELVEKAAAAKCDEEPPCQFCARDAERTLAAIGLIPEHEVSEP